MSRQFSCAINKACVEDIPRALLDKIEAAGIPFSGSGTDVDCVLNWSANTMSLTMQDGERLSARLERPARLGAKQPFTRALAPARGGTIIDATGGLGGDSLMLALVADKVITLERNPVVYAMLAAALHQAREEGWSAALRIEEQFGNAVELISSMPQADVIYIDPMFPPKRRQSALPPKPVRMLRQLVGDDPDAKDLLDVARQHAKQRVVVKHPLHAPTLAEDPVAVHKGKVVRYEVYLPVDS